jgi:hypothetical protein
MEANENTNQRFADLGELRAAVEENGAVLTVKVYEVRDAHGAQRLGRLVRERIGKELAGEGLGIYPRELPEWANEEVRVYRLGSPVADLIEAVERPSEAGDQVIRDAVGGDASGTLDQIRELVCA